MRNQRGFTVIELLVVAVVGSVVVGSIYKVLQTNQRNYTVQTAQVSNQQTVRAGLEVLSSELREMSSTGGDILGIGSDSIRFRAMRKLGLVCSINRATTPLEVVVRTVGDKFEQEERVYVFADDDPDTGSDDQWIVGKIGVPDNDEANCPDGTTGQHIQVYWVPTDLVQIGAPLRSFRSYTYGLYWVAGDWHLARRNWLLRVEPLVGPLLSRNRGGLEFEYFDASGLSTNDPDAVERIQITLRAESEARGLDGELIADSITASIYARN